MFSLCETENLSDWFEKKNICIFGVNVRGLCGSIHRNVFNFSASSRPIFVSLFRAQCGKALIHHSEL